MYHSLKDQKKLNSYVLILLPFLCVLGRFDFYLVFYQSFPPVTGTVGAKNSRVMCNCVSEGFFLTLIENSLVLFRREEKRSGFHIWYSDLCADTGKVGPECWCWLGDLYQLKGDATSSEKLFIDRLRRNKLGGLQMFTWIQLKQQTYFPPAHPN